MYLAKSKNDKFLENASMILYYLVSAISAIALLFSLGRSLPSDYLFLAVFLLVPYALFKLKKMNYIVFIIVTVGVIILEIYYIDSVLTIIDNRLELELSKIHK